MGEQQHTPAPLSIVEAKKLDNSGQWHVYLAAPDGRKIAALWGHQDEKMGNAALFAAAPDMLAILLRIRDSYPGYIPDFIEAVNTAIARATGAQP